jgi:hypothetical protein
MAAVRRGSESGVVVVVVFVVLAVVGIGAAIWCYQQMAKCEKAASRNQADFDSSVGKVFTDNAWKLTIATAPEFGLRYGADSYRETAEKLAEAAQYEKVVRPLVGFDSPEVLKAALADSPLQKEAEAKGQGGFAALKMLLSSYEDAYRNLSREVATLRTDKQDLEKQLADTRQKLVTTEGQLREDLTKANQQYKDDLTKLRQDYDELVTQRTQQQQATVEAQQKQQQEINALQKQVSDLKDDAAQWRKKYEEAIAPPTGKERLVPAGTILELNPSLKLAVIGGGQDQGVKKDEVFVVYSLTPDGKVQKKGLIQVSVVSPTTSRAYISEETKPLLQGDYVVSLERWDIFQRATEAKG